MDQPKKAYHMISTFITGGSLAPAPSAAAQAAGAKGEAAAALALPSRKQRPFAAAAQ